MKIHEPDAKEPEPVDDLESRGDEDEEPGPVQSVKIHARKTYLGKPGPAPEGKPLKIHRPKTYRSVETDY
jgi:hypothetical protein